MRTRIFCNRQNSGGAALPGAAMPLWHYEFSLKK
jgi:hypothetical protein